MPSRVAIPPTVEPLDLEEIKAQLRIQHDSEDVLLSGYLTSCRQAWEQIAARALVAQTVILTYDYFPLCPMILPYSPAISISSITYVDLNGATQTVDNSTYLLDTFTEPNRVVLAYGASWPPVRCQPNAVQVTYTAGYATPLSANATTDVVTFRGRAPVNDERVRLWNSGGSLPGGLLAQTDYYVVQASGQTCQLALTQGGSAVDLINTGSGLHFVGEIPRPILDELKLWVGNRYEQREAVAAQPLRLLLSQNYRLYGVA